MRRAATSKRWRRLALAGGLAGVLLILPACEQRQAAHSAPVRPPAITLDSPEQAVQSLFSGLKQLHDRIAAHDKAAATHCRQALRAVVAEKELIALIDRHPRIKLAINENGKGDVVDGMVRNWASATSYYIDGVHLDRMYRTKAAKAGRVAVVVPASGPADDALIQVTCVRGTDGRWRVLRVEFVVEAPPLVPATREASGARP